MSCLLLKGSSENPAPPKDEVKGPEGGGCKRGHEREAKITVNMEQRTFTKSALEYREPGEAPPLWAVELGPY